MRTWFFSLLLVAMVAASAVADTTESIFGETKSVSPAVLKWNFKVPPFSVEHQVRLSLEARINWPTLAGSNPWITVAVNGHNLTRAELLNKPDDFKLRSGLDLTWFRQSAWRVLYAPDFDMAREVRDKPYSVVDADPYRYVWDITRFVQPGENELQIVNKQVLAQPTTLVLREGQVEVGRPISPPAAAAVQPAPTGALSSFVARGERKLSLGVLPAPGALRVVADGKTYDIATRTSLPAGAWQNAGSDFGAPLKNGQSKTLSWKTAQYEIQREVSVRDDHIHVADTITNTTPNLIGIMVEHRLKYPDKPSSVMLAGREAIGEVGSERNATHPSAFAQWKDGGVGLVAEDDVFRVHIRSACDADGLFLSDDQLGVEPGKPVTLEWSIYPTPRGAYENGDYWDFINAVRRDWGANYAIPGPFSFAMHLDSTKPAAELGQWMRSRDLKIVAGGIAQYSNGQYAHGTGILFAPEWVAQEKQWISKVHQSAPEVKSLCYFHSQISTEPNAETKYAADRLLDNAGQAMSYPYRYPLPMFVATRDNTYGKALWGYVHTILDTIGADGLYWDEMSHSVLEYSPRAPWDGHTVVIDPKTHEVKGKNSSIQLVMQPLQLDIVHYVRDHNKYLMANTQPMTRTMLREKIVRFVETGTYAAVTGTHLGCPLGLGNHHVETTQGDAARNVREILLRGGVYYAHIFNREPLPWNFMSVMYPITPARLGPGFVIGDERIHTAVSGRFGWPDGAAADVYVVDADGNRVAKPDVKEVRENSKRLYEIRMPSDHFAVLVKR